MPKPIIGISYPLFSITVFLSKSNSPMFAFSLGVGTLSVLLSELLSVVAEKDVSELVELLSVLKVAEEDDTAILCDNSELTLSLEFGSLKIFSVEVDVVLSLSAVSLSELLLQATDPKASVSNNKLEIMRFIFSAPLSI